MEVKEKSRRLSKSVTTEEWTVILCDTISETEECIKDSSVIWPIIQRTLARLIDENRESLPSIEIRCQEMVGSIWVTCRRAEVMESLGKLMDWRLGREEYEECAEIRSLELRFLNAPSSVKKSADTDEN